MEALTIPVDFRLDLRRTLSYLPGYFRPDGWWRPTRNEEGPATLHVRRGVGGVEGRAFGPGASKALGSLWGLIGGDDRPGDLQTDHPLIAELGRRHPGLRMGMTASVFEALTIAIITQKVTGKEAGHGLKMLRRRFSDPAPGPAPAGSAPLRLPPDPERLANATYFVLHPLGIEKRRADTLLRAARQANRIEALRAVDPRAAQTWLERIPGIGPWTSAETVAVSHGDPDALSVGDYHLKNLVAWHLTGRPRGTDQEMVDLLEPFRPQRGRVARLISLLGHAPAYGPRQPLRSFAAY
ncbi:MAG TPA: DNA-3-methyladenine glycosylase 2 family protein [Acidimicrobiia bacterium]|nr:DNA-3-methyladenine glycosylase 2 family protein [Acidimicrobiia bacterium]